MSRRSSSETVARVCMAFLQHRTWKQADLARHVGVAPRTVHRHLEELLQAGMPLERDSEPPHVYWSVPANWFPGGTLLKEQELSEVARLLARLPRTAQREAILRRLLEAMPRENEPLRNAAQSSVRDEILTALEEGAARRVAVRIHYFSASHGTVAFRHISVQRIVYGDRPRAIAMCHRSRSLKWFRLERIASAVLDANTEFLAASQEDLDHFAGTSFDGFRGAGPVTDCVFVVRAPESRWAEENMPLSNQAIVEHLPEGAIRVSLKTAALDVLARFVVGLGLAARAESVELRRAVVQIAIGALDANGASINAEKGPAGPKKVPAALNG